MKSTFQTGFVFNEAEQIEEFILLDYDCLKHNSMLCARCQYLVISRDFDGEINDFYNAVRCGKNREEFPASELPLLGNEYGCNNFVDNSSSVSAQLEKLGELPTYW